VARAALYCARHSHPPNPERAKTRSCPRRALSEYARSVSKKGPWPLLSPFFQARSFSPQGWGLIELPRKHVIPISISFSGVAWLILDCARRTSTFLSCAFREQEDDQAILPILLKPHVARAQKIIRLHSLLCSASKKGTWALPPNPLPHIPTTVEATIILRSGLVNGRSVTWFWDGFAGRASRF